MALVTRVESASYSRSTYQRGPECILMWVDTLHDPDAHNTDYRTRLQLFLQSASIQILMRVRTVH